MTRWDGSTALLLIVLLLGACSGSPAEPESWVSVAYYGAREGTWEQREVASIVCRLADGNSLTVEASYGEGVSRDRFSLSISPFDGAVYQDLTAGDPMSFTMLTLSVGELYSYWFAEDFSRQTGKWFSAWCTGQIYAGDAAPWGRARGHLVCMDLPADLLSADRQESPEDRQPYVDLVLDFNCPLEVVP